MWRQICENIWQNKSGKWVFQNLTPIRKAITFQQAFHATSVIRHMQRLKLDSSIDKEDEGRVWKPVTHFEWLISDYVIIFWPFQTLLFDATPTAETAPADEWAFILTLEKKQHQKWRPCRKKVLKNTIRPLEKKTPDDKHEKNQSRYWTVASV